MSVWHNVLKDIVLVQSGELGFRVPRCSTESQDHGQLQVSLDQTQHSKQIQMLQQRHGVDRVYLAAEEFKEAGSAHSTGEPVVA